MWVSLGVTLTFVLFEALAGARAHSLALLSDAGHNLSDALALGLAAFAIWIAHRPASARNTFGYHRVAILTALFNALSLLALAAGIGYEAIQRFLHPEPVAGTLMIVVATVAVLMNTLIAVSLAGDAKHSLNSRAAYVHMAGDALSSVAVVIAGIIAKYTGWVYADPTVSAMIAVFIVYSAWDIVRDATDILLENTPKGINVEALVAEIHRIPFVCGVHDLHIWTVSDGMHFLSCHVTMPPEATLEDCVSVVQAIDTKLHDDFGIGHATIQTEPVGSCRRLPNENSLDGLYCGMEPHRH